MKVGDMVTFRTLRNQDPPDHQLLGVVVRQGESAYGMAANPTHWFVLWANGEAPVSSADYDLEVISEGR